MGSEHLVIQQGDDISVFAVAGEVTSVGRSRAADLCLDDAAVSRRHALLVRRDGATRVVDDRSLNGVRVNGERVTDAVLADGDEIAIGRVLLRYMTGVPAEPADRANRATDRPLASA
jgi:pSer/pThr/pTyr-binding forkhead associated (FHA) protein